MINDDQSPKPGEPARPAENGGAPGEPASGKLEHAFAHIRPKRPALWLLVIPTILYLLTPVVANSIHPILLGMPFIVFYTVVVTVLTWAIIWLTARIDPIYRAGAVEPVPADIAFGEAPAEDKEAGR
ncbi:DUF3311 domain-containing protein [Spelaeicoccus albus]|uniref:DUF3311 domain-containing protein n=1 Tax=Spelaeicoccus albus TaxID=1280376 RepID=A0A7Z0A9L3_9MICO|nr:DUF3311 domain-containing protein [Spelaeicoccus albus]NYI66857.1 hypothetical protein [Spelaeicoccus albus]